MDKYIYSKPALVGHPFSPIGRGESFRCWFRAFQAAGRILQVRNIYPKRSIFDEAIKEEIGEYLTSRLSSMMNLFCINGDEVEPALRYLGNDLPDGAYNIVFPVWELSIYPPEWAKQLERFDEIWTPSKFVFDSICAVVSRPVYHMPHSVGVQLTSFLGRRYFGLPESSFLFLFFFDFRSYIERKNPLAVINAFQSVCAVKPDGDIKIVIKLNKPGDLSKDEELANFMEAINNYEYKDNFIIIDKVLTDNEMKNLMRCCDCFISLHRSEGFGRGMAEAMYLGKPVIATGYSGNLDFMNENNSLIVNYKLISVKEGQYPYPDGQVWAEPDIDHAVYCMLKLINNRDFGRKLGEVASRYMRTFFSYRAMGLRYWDRLKEISLQKGFNI